jgi:oligoribonuclease (3'-5' exoribonuclease)
MIKEFKILSDLYSEPDKEGKQKIIKRSIISRMLINTEDINFIEELVNKNGKIVKNCCIMKVNNDSYRIKHSYDEIKEFLHYNITAVSIKGFMYKNKK